MKKNYIISITASVILTVILTACNDFLDIEPLSKISPNAYLNEESQLAAYAIKLYPDILPSHATAEFGMFSSDKHTDIQAAQSYDNRYVPGEWKTAQSGGSWSFTNIYACNYFLKEVLPRWKAGQIAGNSENINQYIGEIYFLRAYEYFKKYQEFGDFPIIRTTLPDERETLVEASKRFPRNEVARFIISDLDSAIMLTKAVVPGKQRISAYAAHLIKSRVALCEGTWLKYFKGTAFVPNGEGWPGKSKDYNASYQYPSGSIEKETEYFLTLAMSAAKEVADNNALVENNGIIQQKDTDPINPYHELFAAINMSGFSEILLWRQYNKGLGIVHNVPVYAQKGNNGFGLTRGYVESFLMANGLPIYAPASGYAGDDQIPNVRTNRDNRLFLFLKEPGQINVIWPSPEGTHATPVETVPTVTNGAVDWTYTTGYAVRKGLSPYGNQCANGQGFTGCPVFRAAEAYLNYMEACYEKNGSLDDKAKAYWASLRRRAKVDVDFEKTINATDMSKEALNNWGAYSAGQLINPTLYNIRRERGCELMVEGFRYMDLRRWRAMDQMITTPYHIEGFKLWGPIQELYNTGAGGASILVYGLDKNGANVSPPDRSLYLRPYEKNDKSLVLNGYKWVMAHYLSPIAIQNFLNTTEDNDMERSPIYQNPGWPLTANTGANK